MRKVILSLTVICILLITVPASAQLLIEQGKISETLNRGQTLTGELKLNNTSDRALDVRVTWEDFQYVEPFDGKKKFLPPGSTDRSLFGMIRFSPQEFELPPFSKQVINFTLSLPEGQQEGLNGVMFFEQRPQGQNNITGVRIVTRVGTLFFINPSGVDKTSHVQNIDIKDGQLTGIFENAGKTILFPKGIYYILDHEGIAVSRGEIKKMYLMPGSKKEFQIMLNEKMTDGTYTLILTFDLEEGESKVVEIDFVKRSGQYRIERIGE